MAKDLNKLRAQIIAKAWKDPVFKQKLLKNPKAALKEMGWEIPDAIDVRIVEDKQNAFTFVLPPLNVNIQEMSNEELERVAGGKGHSGHQSCRFDPELTARDGKCPCQ